MIIVMAIVIIIVVILIMNIILVIRVFVTFVDRRKEAARNMHYDKIVKEEEMRQARDLYYNVLLHTAYYSYQYCDYSYLSVVIY